MRKPELLVVGAIAAALCSWNVAPASAQCAFNAPMQAKGIKTSLVRAYAGCPGITFPSPNTSTMAGVPGCTPPLSLSEYTFGEGSRCSVTSRLESSDVCRFPTPSPCLNVKVGLKCAGLLTPMGEPTNDPGWSLAILSRATLDDAGLGDTTVVDFPAVYELPQASDGKLKFKFDLVRAVCPLLECYDPGPCASDQILGIRLYDPDGNLFASAGSSTR